MYTRRRHHQEVQTIQVRLREGDRDVSPFSQSSRSHLLTNHTYRYAYFKKLDYFSTECIYSPDAYRGHARAFLKDLEAARPSAIIDIIHSGEAFAVKEEVKATQKAQREWCPGIPHSLTSCSCDATETCKRCGYMSSNELCKACSLLEGLERGVAAAGVVSAPNLLRGSDLSTYDFRRIEGEGRWMPKAQHRKGCGQYPTSRCPRAQDHRRRFR